MITKKFLGRFALVFSFCLLVFGAAAHAADDAGTMSDPAVVSPDAVQAPALGADPAGDAGAPAAPEAVQAPSSDAAPSDDAGASGAGASDSAQPPSSDTPLPGDAGPSSSDQPPADN